MPVTPKRSPPDSCCRPPCSGTSPPIPCCRRRCCPTVGAEMTCERCMRNGIARIARCSRRGTGDRPPAGAFLTDRNTFASTSRYGGLMTGPIRVLVAEDDVDLQSFLRDTLEAEGMEVHAASDGAGTLLAVGSEPPD